MIFISEEDLRNRPGEDAASFPITVGVDAPEGRLLPSRAGKMKENMKAMTHSLDAVKAVRGLQQDDRELVLVGGNKQQRDLFDKVAAAIMEERSREKEPGDDTTSKDD